MPILDLSEEDVALLEAAKKAGGASGLDMALRAKALHDKLYTHKDVGRDYQRAIKTVFPDVQTTDDIAAPYLEKVDAVAKRLDDFVAEREREKEEAAKAASQADFESQWNGVVKSYSLSEEGEEKLLDFMKKRRLADPEAAAALYYKQNPEPPVPIAPSAISPKTWGIGPLPGEDPESSKLLLTNPERWADIEAANVLNEGRRAA